MLNFKTGGKGSVPPGTEPLPHRVRILNFSENLNNDRREKHTEVGFKNNQEKPNQESKEKVKIESQEAKSWRNGKFKPKMGKEMGKVIRKNCG